MSFPNKTDQCVLAISNGTTGGEIGLGSLFMASYYTEFDYDKMHINIGVNSKNAWSSTITIAPKASDVGLNWWEVLLIIIGSFLVLVLIAFVSWYCFCRKKDQSAMDRNKIMAKIHAESVEDSPLMDKGDKSEDKADTENLLSSVN